MAETNLSSLLTKREAFLSVLGGGGGVVSEELIFSPSVKKES